MRELSGTSCEGRCGSRLDPDMRELSPRHEPEPGDWAPFHTTDRCRIIKLYRDYLERALPDWTIEVYPLWQGRLMTRAHGIVDGLLHSQVQAVPEEAPYGSLPLYAEANAREVASDLMRLVNR